MPKMGYDMREGTVVRWHKREGETVARGEVIADIETDKATVEFEAYTGGVMQRLVAQEGVPVPVGEAIAVIGDPATEIAAVPPPVAAAATAAPAVAAVSVPQAAPAVAAVSVPQAAPAVAAVAVPQATPSPISAAEPDGEVRASPIARRLARERGIDLTQVTGTGPGGRIVEKDILSYTPAAVPDPAAETVAPAAAPAEWILASPLARRLARERGIALAQVAGSGPGGRVVARDVPEYAAPAAVEPAAEVADESVPAAVEPAADVAAETVPAAAEPAAEVAAGTIPVSVEPAAEVADEIIPEAIEPAAEVTDETVPAAVEPAAEVAAEIIPAAVELAADVADETIPAAVETVPEPEAPEAAVAERSVETETVSPVAALVGESVPLSRMRQAIARVTGDSKRDAPHFYITAEVDMGKAMALRRDINDALPADQRVSVNDLIVRAAALALGQHPQFNAFFRGDHLQYHAAINIGIAITLESGLIVPGISHCESKSLVEIAAASKDLIARAHSGALRQEEYGDTTFSVSNLGMFAVDSFAAIIFPPHAAVLAVGAVKEQPIAREGQLAVGQVMKATLSTDHRVADGAAAAQFLVAVKGLLENPVTLLL